MVKRADARSWIAFVVLLALFVATVGLRTAGLLSHGVSDLVCAALILSAIGVGVSRAVRRGRQDPDADATDADHRGMRSDA
ncbi:MAG: hypothetical protein EOO27_22190 [Comamonadaceae bacterium]|nr:MAG: hypothetical protein EOO27_22190 [Comamonadaceae bacterium]